MQHCAMKGPPMLHKDAGEIQETVMVQDFFDIKSWDPLPGRAKCEGAIAFSPKGRFLAVGLRDGGVGIWDLDTIPHLALTLELPEKVKARRTSGEGETKQEEKQQEDVEEIVEYEVAGFSWGPDATKLLVTVKEDDQDSHFCLWDLVTGECINYLAWPSACGLPQLLPLANERKCIFSTDSSSGPIIVDIDTGATTMTGLLSPDVVDEANGKPGPGSKAKQPSTTRQPSACVVGQGGKVGYCVINRKVYKFDLLELREIASSDTFGLFSACVTSLLLSPDEKYLLAGSNRGGHLFNAESLQLLQSLAGQRSEVEWMDWTCGFNNHIIAIPASVMYQSKQEHMFVWAIEDQVARKGARDTKVWATLVTRQMPKEGLSATAINPTRPMVAGISPSFGLLMHQETYTSSFPGAMYPKGYVVLDNNTTYLEKEDELDKVIMRVGKPGETVKKMQEDEAAAAALARVKESEVLEESFVDIVTTAEGEEEEWVPVKRKEGRIGDYPIRRGWGGEEKVALRQEIRPLVGEMDETNDADGDDKEGIGGIPGLHPMPRLPSNKRADRMPVRKGDASSYAGRQVIIAALERIVRKGLPGQRRREQEAAAAAAAAAASGGGSVVNGFVAMNGEGQQEKRQRIDGQAATFSAAPPPQQQQQQQPGASSTAAPPALGNDNHITAQPSSAQGPQPMEIDVNNGCGDSSGVTLTTTTILPSDNGQAVAPSSS